LQTIYKVREDLRESLSANPVIWLKSRMVKLGSAVEETANKIAGGNSCRSSSS